MGHAAAVSEAAMKTYNYKTIDVSSLPLATLESTFDALGTEGYEMVGVILRKGVSHAVFKRENAPKKVLPVAKGPRGKTAKPSSAPLEK